MGERPTLRFSVPHARPVARSPSLGVAVRVGSGGLAVSVGIAEVALQQSGASDDRVKSRFVPSCTFNINIIPGLLINYVNIIRLLINDS